MTLMKSLTKFKIFLFFFTIFLTSAAIAIDERDDELVISGQIANCPVDKALAGDRKAALQCTDHYLKDPKPRRYWEQIAAENGDPIAQYNFAMTLLSGKNPLERKRAIYWLQKAAAQGDASASEALHEVRLHPDALFPLPPPKRP